MRASLSNGTRVSIGWQYSTCQKELKHANGPKTVNQDCVTCFIRRVPATGEEPKSSDVLSEITITRYHKDADNKPLARKTTFGMAVAGFSKRDKEILWDIFLKNVKLPGQKKKKSESKSAEAA